MKQILKKIVLFCICALMCAGFAGEAFAASAADAPVLKETTCYEEAGKLCCTFIFKTVKDAKYRVYRRTPNSKKYVKLGDVIAKSALYSFQDKTVKKGGIYYYTVRRVLNGGKSLSKYDATGIKGICFDCTPKIRLTTLYGTIVFKTTPEASKYILYRRTNNSAWQAIKTFGATANASITYNDTYYLSLKTQEDRKNLINDTFVDPTANPFRYEVRAIYTTAGGYISRGHYTKEGNCVVATPALAEVTVGTSQTSFVWAGIPVARTYNIYAKSSKNGEWVKLAIVKHTDSKIQRATVKTSRAYNYYTVRAFANCRGKTVSGGFEDGFSIINRKYSHKKALFLGDSIALGRPYKGEMLHYFTYSKRVEQLTGMQCDNISMTAATISDNYYSIEKQSIWADQVRQVYLGEMPNIPSGFERPASLARLWEYDYIVLQGGTNDYNSSIPLGIPECSDAATFNGALNKIKNLINAANLKRYKLGKPSIKVIVMDISYSQRCGSKYTQILCRQDTPNKLGLTATDYTNEMRANLSDGMLNVHFIPATAILNESNCIYESADNLHYTKVGYGKMGNILVYTMLNW